MTTAYMGFWIVGIAVGLVAAIAVAVARRSLNWVTFVGGTIAWCGLVVGAKLQYRLEHFPLGYALQVSLSELIEPGVRIPLGLLLGGVLGLLWVFAWRGPWRETGDALAVGAAVMIPIGRIGCLTNGCCMGAVCGKWALPFCVGYPPGTESYNQQLRDNLIALSDPMSLPAHPLPLYFAVGSLFILGVMLWQFRRGARPGTMLLTACILGPASKLAFETLRAEPRAPGLMFLVPATVLAVASVVAILRFARDMTVAPADESIVGSARGAVVGLLAFLVGTAVAVPPARASTPETPPGVAELAAYAKDPVRNRRALRRLERSGTEDLPPPVLLAMGDARLRSGQRRAAERLFEEVIARDPGEPWVGWARYGLGWSAVLTGDVDAARAQFEELGASEGPLATSARLIVFMLDASDGKPVPPEAYEQLAQDPSASSSVRDAANLGAAYARYWAGDFAGARKAFQAIAAGSGPLADDARYGAAWARLRAGDRDGAEVELRALAAGGRSRGPGMNAALVNLDPRAVVRAGFQRYRRGPLRTPGQDIVEIVQTDGHELARSALRHLDDAPRLPRGTLRRPLSDGYRDGLYREDRDGTAAPSAAVARQGGPGGRPEASAPEARGGASAGRSRWYVILLTTAVVVALTLVLGRRRGTRAQHGPGRW
jgi:phosphatidylglycerol:prolipoprotein diacylglycerol transferase